MKKSRIDVEILPLLHRGGQTVIKAKVSGHPRRRKRNGTLFFRVPSELHDWLSVGGGDEIHDCFLRALIFSAMEANRDISIHGRISSSLLANLADYQQMICAEIPAYRPVNMLADEVIRPAAMGTSSGETIMGFTGGLDSIYTLFTHQTGQSELVSRSVPTCIFVHGFDIPLEDRAYDRAFESARQITQSLSSTLYPVRTNLKRMLPSWRNSHGAGLAAVLSLFQGRYSTALIASSYADDNPFALRSGYGSTPRTDPLLSSSTFSVLHDVGKNRAQKSEVLENFDVGRRHLRVCWEGDDLAANCGQCGKCLLQMIAMRLAGVEDLSMFQTELDLDAVARTNLSSEAYLRQWKSLVEYAIDRGRGHLALVNVMQKRIEECETIFEAGQIPGDTGHKQRWGKRVLKWMRHRVAGNPATRAA